MTKYLSLLVLGTLIALVTLVTLVTTTGCAHAQAAKATPDNPPLDIPAPPPRDVEVGGTEVALPPIPLPQEPARNPTPARPRPTPPPPNRPEAPKPEPPKAEPAPEPPKPAGNEDSKPASTLQTKPPSEEGEAERVIRQTLTRATNDLNRVDYRTLNADARSQYDYAKQFIRQAEDAVRQKNLFFAKTVAEKAAALAAQLAGR